MTHIPIAVFTPLPWQIAPWRDKSPVMLCTGSAGGGKSRLCAEKCHAFALKYPGSTVLVVRKAREWLRNSTVLFMDRAIIGDDPSVRHIQSKSRWEYANGSIMAYGGMVDDRQKEAIRGIGQDGGLDFLWMEEATQFVEGDFDELSARMRGKAAPWMQMMMSCNPDAPQHWVYQRLIQGGEATVHYSSAVDNSHNPAAYRESLGRLRGVLGQRLRDGKWCQAEGVVFESFEVDRHVWRIEEAAARGILHADGSRNWDVLREIRCAMDWGYTGAGVLQVWGFDGDGRMYLVEEIVRRGKLLDWWEARTGEAVERWVHGEKRDARIVADPSEPEHIERFRRAGFHIEPANNVRKLGALSLEERFAEDEEGRPRIVILDTALSGMDPEMEAAHEPCGLLQEIPGYVWDSTKEDMVKENDHSCDAFRYMGNDVDGVGGEESFAPVSLGRMY